MTAFDDEERKQREQQAASEPDDVCSAFPRAPLSSDDVAEQIEKCRRLAAEHRASGNWHEVAVYETAAAKIAVAALATTKARLSAYETGSVCEIGAINFNVRSYCEHWEGRVTNAEARTERLEKALRDAIECVEAWSAYADEYYKKKHDLAGDLARLRAALAEEADDGPRCADEARRYGV